MTGAEGCPSEGITVEAAVNAAGKKRVSVSPTRKEDVKNIFLPTVYNGKDCWLLIIYLSQYKISGVYIQELYGYTVCYYLSYF